MEKGKGKCNKRERERERERMRENEGDNYIQYPIIYCGIDTRSPTTRSNRRDREGERGEIL